MDAKPRHIDTETQRLYLPLGYTRMQSTLRWCSPANHLALSRQGPGFKSLTEHFSSEHRGRKKRTRMEFESRKSEQSEDLHRVQIPDGALFSFRCLSIFGSFERGTITISNGSQIHRKFPPG